MGTASNPFPVTLQNTGNQALTISTFSVTGANSGDFSLSQNCPSSLAVNASCQINVTFTPTASGTRTAAVTLFDNATVSPQSIPIYGVGLGPAANLSASSLTFPGQFVGTTGLPENITLTNNGNAPLTISSIQASAQFGASNGCTSSLAVGVNCTISVFFDPSSAGSQTGTLTITDNAPGSPQTVQLSGTGMDFALSSPAPSVSVAAGQQATYAVTVTPQGGAEPNGEPDVQRRALAIHLHAHTQFGHVEWDGIRAGDSGYIDHGVVVGATVRESPPAQHHRVGANILAVRVAAGESDGAGRGGKRRAAILLGACLLIAMFWSACGGGTPQVVQTPGTPTGTYTLDVSATVTSAATSSTLTHDLKLTLTVN